MKTIETKVYEYDELSDEAKEKAREWYIQGAYDYDWYDFIYDEAKNLGFEIESFDIYHKQIEIKLHDTAENISKKIIAEHGKNCDTHKTAKKYLTELARITKKMKQDESISTDEIDEEFQQSLAEDYLAMLIAESEYMISEEAIKEMMEANEYTFTADGKRFG